MKPCPWTHVLRAQARMHGQVPPDLLPLLNWLHIQWTTPGQPYPLVVNVMMCGLASTTTAHRQIGRLRKIGLVKLTNNRHDARRKHVAPTPKAIRYFADLSDALLHAQVKAQAAA